MPDLFLTLKIFIVIKNCKLMEIQRLINEKKCRCAESNPALRLKRLIGVI